MAQVLIKDNYIPITATDEEGVYEFDLLGFKFTGFRKWLLSQDNSYTTHTVEFNEVGMLDLISYENYGTESYWWVIAVANNFMDPVAEVTFNKVLIIPSREAVAKYIASLTSSDTTQTVIEL